MKRALEKDGIVTLQLVIRDAQFDFVEELTNYLEGILLQIDSVRSICTETFISLSPRLRLFCI